MGIVVCVFMLLGLLLLWPWSSPTARGRQRRRAWARSIAIGVLLAGAWNALWHGLRHLDAFWGIAALLSGLLMMATAARVLRRLLSIRTLANPAAPAASGGLTDRLLFVGLLVCFALYAVTLFRLNLGYSIIGQ
ncbi:MAG: hypothetical protein ABI434_22330 [Burkholderiaceae bacterium]